jgi:hypothetical protein
MLVGALFTRTGIVSFDALRNHPLECRGLEGFPGPVGAAGETAAIRSAFELI